MSDSATYAITKNSKKDFSILKRHRVYVNSCRAKAKMLLRALCQQLQNRNRMKSPKVATRLKIGIHLFCLLAYVIITNKYLKRSHLKF